MVRIAACTALTKRRTMRSSSRLSTAASASSISATIGRLAPCRALAGLGARIEPRVEQLDDLGGEAACLRKRRPHVVLRIRHADLAQEPRDGADQRDVAPAEPRRHHQRVVAVVLGDAAHHRDERRFQRAPSAAEIGRPPSARSSTMSCSQASTGVALADLEGALVDDAEAHVLQHRHPLRQRDRPAVAPDLQADAGLAVLDARERNRRRAAAPAISASMSRMSSTATAGE